MWLTSCCQGEGSESQKWATLMRQFSKMFMSCGHLKVAVMAPANGHVLHLAAFKIASWDSHWRGRQNAPVPAPTVTTKAGGHRSWPCRTFQTHTRHFYFYCKYDSIFFQTESTSQPFFQEVPARDARASPVPTEVLRFWFSRWRERLSEQNDVKEIVYKVFGSSK